jgi:plastocyanin
VRSEAAAALFLAAVAHLAPTAAQAAVVEGRVSLRAPSVPAAPSAQRYPAGIAEQVEPPDAPAAIVSLEPELPLDGSPNGARAASSPARIAVAQKGLQFRPGILAVRVGTVVEFPNHDDTYHSVFSYSKPKRFDLGRYRKGEEPAALVFDTPGVVKLYCEIHQHMRGTVLVLETPWFAKTDPDGAFRIADVPAGRYVVRAWLDEETVWTRPLTVEEGARVFVELAPP